MMKVKGKVSAMGRLGSHTPRSLRLPALRPAVWSCWAPWREAAQCPGAEEMPSHHIYASGAEVIVFTSALSQMHSCGGKNFLGRALLNFQSRLCVTSDGQQRLVVGRQSIPSPGMSHVRALVTWELVLFQHFSWAIARAYLNFMKILSFFPK